MKVTTFTTLKIIIIGSCRSLRMQGICQQCVDQNVLGTFWLKWNRCLLGTDWTKSPESPSDFLSWRAMADAKTTPLTITKASPEEAAPGDSPDIPDIEMVDSTREWPVENDAWQYLHEDVQDSAAAKEQAAHEVLMPPLTPCHKMDDEQQKSMEDLNTAIASMQVTFDALAVGAPAAEKFAPTSLGPPEGAGALGPGTPEGGDVVSSLAPGSAESHAMDSTPPPRKRPLEVPALPGFTRASTSTSSTASSPIGDHHQDRGRVSHWCPAGVLSSPLFGGGYLGSQDDGTGTLPALREVLGHPTHGAWSGTDHPGLPAGTRSGYLSWDVDPQAPEREGQHFGPTDERPQLPWPGRTDQLGAMLKVPETVDSREATLPLLLTTGLCPGPYGHSPLILQRWYQYLGAFRSQRTVSTARNEEMMKESSAVDASGLGEQPPSTTTLEELSFSEQVPSSTRMSLREEIMDQKMDSELEEIQSKVQAHRLQDRIPGQSFKVFHPDTAKAMHLQGQELWSGEPDPQRQARLEAKRREQKQLQEEVVENQAEVLTYLQAGMHSVPEDEVRSAALISPGGQHDGLTSAPQAEVLGGQSLRHRWDVWEGPHRHCLSPGSQLGISASRGRIYQTIQTGHPPCTLVACRPPIQAGERTLLSTGGDAGFADPEWEAVPPALLGDEGVDQRRQEPLRIRAPGRDPGLWGGVGVLSGTAAGAQGPGTAPEGTEPLSEEAKRLGMLRWCMHHHAGELRMYGGRWVRSRTPEGTPSPIPTRARPLKHAETVALEKRTHPVLCSGDTIEPILYSDSELEQQIRDGQRPAFKDIRGGFWAEGPDFTWVRESRTWDLPSMLHVYGARYILKWIYAPWSALPIIIATHRRGKDSKDSKTANRHKDGLQIIEEAKSFLEVTGLPMPQDKEEWRLMFKEMGSFLATKSFLTNTPPPVMQLPVAEIHDSKEAMRYRAICDERVTLPMEALRSVPSVWKPKPGGVVDLLKSDYDKSGPRRPQRTQSQVCLQAAFQMILWTPARKMRRSPLRRSKDCQPNRRCRWKARESNLLDDQPFASWMQVPLALVYPWTKISESSVLKFPQSGDNWDHHNMVPLTPIDPWPPGVEDLIRTEGAAGAYGPGTVRPEALLTERGYP